MTIDVLKSVWVCFVKILATGKEKNRQSISFNQLLRFIEEREYSIVIMSLIRFFDMIDKKDPNNELVSFDELLPVLSSYCLFSRSEILGFVFAMIDEDRD